MPTSRTLRRALVVGCALALALFATHDTTSFAQRRAGNPCLDIVRAAELPIQGLDTVRPPRGLHTACRQFVRMPAPTRSNDSVERTIAWTARMDSYRAILEQLIAVTECEGRCALLRETITAYVLERLARDVYAAYEVDLERYDTPEFRRRASRMHLERVTNVVRRYDQAIALAHTEPLVELEAALRRRRDAVDGLRTRLRVDAIPMIPGTQCAAELETVYAPEAPARTSRTVIVFASSEIDAPLTEAEYTHVVDAARDTIARTSGRVLPPQRSGPASALGDRLFIEAVLYRAKTGMPWRDLPERFGPWKSASFSSRSMRPAPSSTVPLSARTKMRPAEKGDRMQCSGTLSRRLFDEAPRRRRHARATDPRHAHARSEARNDRCRRAARERSWQGSNR